MTTNQLLKIDGLKRYFPVTKGMVLQKVIGNVKAVDDISFVVNEGETFSLVGESGCGKSTTANLVLKLDDPTAGDLYFQDEKITGMKGSGLQNYRRSVQVVFQDPFRSLNPRRKVKSIIAQPLVAQNVGAEQEWLDYYHLTKDTIAINALPDVDYLVSKLKWLIDNPAELENISKNAHAFIEKAHNYTNIGNLYLKHWKSNT